MRLDRIRKPYALVLGIALAIGALMAGATAAQASTVDLLSSSTPKSVVLDADTGKLLSVTTGAMAEPLISNRNICQRGDGCYHSGRVPYAHQGFYGTRGTYNGSWPYRSSWNTGNYTARACWVQACSQYAFGPNTQVSFNGSLVTGTSFTIY